MVGIKKSSDFRTIYRARDSKANILLILYKKENFTNENRIGISVSKKVGNSVVRHRLKRQVREIARLNDDVVKQGYDLIVVLRANARNAPYSLLEDSYLNLIRRHGLMIML